MNINNKDSNHFVLSFILIVVMMLVVGCGDESSSPTAPAPAPAPTPEPAPTPPPEPTPPPVDSTMTPPPADVYTPLPGLQVSPGMFQYGPLPFAECLELDNRDIGGVTYTAHNSKWQRRDSSTDPWTDIPGTEQAGVVCPYSPGSPGEYRLVAEVTIGGSRGKYSSENTITVSASTPPPTPPPAPTPPPVDSTMTLPPADVYMPLTGLQVSPGMIQYGLFSFAECLNLDNQNIGGVTYTTHNSKWQRRDSSTDPWADIPDTEQAGVCPYSPDSPGEYRLVAEITIDGAKGKYSSENTITVE